MSPFSVEANDQSMRCPPVEKQGWNCVRDSRFDQAVEGEDCQRGDLTQEIDLNRAFVGEVPLSS